MIQNFLSNPIKEISNIWKVTEEEAKSMLEENIKLSQTYKEVFQAQQPQQEENKPNQGKQKLSNDK